MIEMSHTITNVSSEPFSNPHIKKILDLYIRKASTRLYLGRQRKKDVISSCDPFARESFTRSLNGCITNDLNTDFDTDYNLEFLDFAQLMSDKKKSFDVVFFDPPYSLRQLKDCYDGIGKDLELWQTHNMWREGKDILAPLVNLYGYVISLGWSSSGFGKKRGFKKVAVHVFEQAGKEDRYDVILTVEQKVQQTLEDYCPLVES